MDNLEKQAEEIEVLKNIYLDELKIESEDMSCFSMELKQDNIKVYLCFTIPEDYPLASPPVCDVSAPALSKNQKDQIYNELNDIYSNNLGETILYQWIEKVRELLESFASNVSPEIDTLTIESMTTRLEETPLSCPEIIHGEIIEDRKSHFQAHVAIIKCREEVEIVLKTLKKERKIADATHNMVAWKCGVHQDCDDDGEKAAGGRLLHLLDLLNVQNTIVVVSRWYGGTNLGPQRFRHINNAARQALLQAKIIDQ